MALYSHDSVGLGHTRRNLAIAHALGSALPALTGRRVSGLLVTGERTATSYPAPEGWDWVVMPGIHKRDGRYAPRALDVGMDRLMGVRSSVVDGVLGSFRPHLAVVDRHAFGVDGELAGPLANLRRDNPGCRLVLGLREVLDAPSAAAAEWARVGVERVAETFDELWVYGDAGVHDPVAGGEIPGALAGRVRFTGYLSAGRHCAEPAGDMARPYLLTMAGGGSDGYAMTRAAAAARVPAGYRHLVVTGPQMPAALREKVRAAAAPGTRVLASVPDGLAYIRSAAAVVVMGGYNTVCEVLGSAAPALVVPRVAPRTEQLIRGRSLEARGAVRVLHPDRLGAEAIGDWFSDVARAAGPGVGPPSAGQLAARGTLALDGLSELAGHAARLVGAAAAPTSASSPAPAAGPHREEYSHAAV
ncbi:MAG: glycosyl transferase family 28 [Arthrobacter sp.]